MASQLGNRIILEKSPCMSQKLQTTHRFLASQGILTQKMEHCQEILTRKTHCLSRILDKYAFN
jgi:hypothetical protein